MSRIDTGRAPYQKAEKVKPAPQHMARVASLPCVICTEWGMAQHSPTQVHHVIHGRGGNRKVPDTMTIPLCEGHHQGLRDGSKIALHREPDEWKRRYGEDKHWLNWVEARLEGE